jgi:hypothetical protein
MKAKVPLLYSPPFSGWTSLDGILFLEARLFLRNVGFCMKLTSLSIVAILSCIGLSACNKSAPNEQASYQCISAKLSIGDKQVDSVVQWNTKTGEARLLNAASFADKATGQQGNLIGWVPLVDLQQAVQNLASQIQAQQAAKAGASPASTPIQPKK